MSKSARKPKTVRSSSATTACPYCGALGARHTIQQCVDRLARAALKRDRVSRKRR